MRIAICDDCKTDAIFVIDLIRSWANQNETELQYMIFSSAEQFLFHYEEDKNFDILFLDIEMGKMDGVTLAKNVRKENDIIQIVFITGYSDYIAEGYEVAALHYLMKPLDRDKLFSVLARAVKLIEQNEICLTLDLPDETVKIAFHEIIYLDVFKNYVTVHAKKNYTVKQTLSEFEKQLDERFFRVGRGLIVNLGYIRKVTKTEVYLSEGEVLQIPASAYKPLNQAIIAHT